MPEHGPDCRCAACVEAILTKPKWTKAPGYRPSPKLAVIAVRHPDIEWLVYQPRKHRQWYADPGALLELLLTYPEVSEAEWVMILR